MKNLCVENTKKITRIEIIVIYLAFVSSYNVGLEFVSKILMFIWKIL